jgi:glycosyltransferase involved in cell wall biosynthesis
MKLSVIIPIYNVELIYFEKCINSILNQSYFDYEIICVVDGQSEENEICIDYLNKMQSPKIKVTINDSNYGVSYCRNKGISLSNSEFITFVDSDDYIDKDMYYGMLQCDI